ncbi:hypothetical protein AB9U01_25215 [Pseudomonas qingdaonensis]|uniref:hypothetical protein n=1 Tax=Pseudomonas qingdaonensis TaxID=2056231 RepID=UPI0035113359
MHAAMEVTGEDVIGLPGQALSSTELLTLVGLADGTPTPVLAKQLNLDDFAINQIERGIQQKLGAKNRLHMVTRGFTLGVLVPRALVMLLCLTAALEVNHDMLRPRTQRRSRSGYETVRITRLAPQAGAGRAPLFA